MCCMSVWAHMQKLFQFSKIPESLLKMTRNLHKFVQKAQNLLKFVHHMYRPMYRYLCVPTYLKNIIKCDAVTSIGSSPFEFSFICLNEFTFWLNKHVFHWHATGWNQLNITVKSKYSIICYLGVIVGLFIVEKRKIIITYRLRLGMIAWNILKLSEANIYQHNINFS